MEIVSGVISVMQMEWKCSLREMSEILFQLLLSYIFRSSAVFVTTDYIAQPPYMRNDFVKLKMSPVVLM